MSPFVRWSEVPEPEDKPSREPLPAGEYPCKVVEVTARRKQGFEEWSMKLEVTAGPHQGRWVWDWLRWGGDSEEKAVKALKRARLVCERLGLDTSRDGHVSTTDLVAREALVTMKQERYDGKVQTKVEYGGYRPLDSVRPASSEPPF